MSEIYSIIAQIEKGCNTLDKQYILNALNVTRTLLGYKSVNNEDMLKLIEGIREYFRKIDQPHSDIVSKINKLEEEKKKFKKAIDILNEKNNDLKNELRDLIEKLSSADNVINILKLDANKLSDTNSKYYNDNKRLKKIIDNYKNTSLSYNDNANQLVEKDNIIIQKNSEIEKLSTIIKAYKKKYIHLENQFRFVVNGKEDHEIEYSKLEEKLKLKEKDIVDLKELLNKLNKKCSELENESILFCKLLQECEESKEKLNIIEKLTNNESLEIRNLNNVVTLYDESLRYYEDGKFLKISIYIQDISNKNYENIEDLHKYHIYNCRTIHEMKSRNRDFRYCVSTRSDNYFKYKIYRKNKVEVYNDNHELYVCKNCLSIYNKQYVEFNNVKIEEPIEFNQKKLLEQYIKSDLIELDNKELVLLSSEYVYDYEQIPNIYSEKWPALSQVFKDTKNHTCEECQWQPKSSEEARYLHVHHINFKKFDNDFGNLKVLCIDCHSNQPNHKHIKKSRDWKNFQKIR